MSIIYPPLREQWFGNVRGDVLSGILVALALRGEYSRFEMDDVDVDLAQLQVRFDF